MDLNVQFSDIEVSSVQRTSDHLFKMSSDKHSHESEPVIGWLIAFFTYFSYAIIISVSRNVYTYLSIDFNSFLLAWTFKRLFWIYYRNF